MRRREFLGLLGLTVARSPGAGAQAVKDKIGYVHPVTASPSHITFSILQKEWRRLGYVEGQNLLVRSGEGDVQRLPGVHTVHVRHEHATVAAATAYNVVTM